MKKLLLFLLIPVFTPAFSQFSGNALDFDGTNDMVVCSAVPSLFSNLTTSDFTIEAWVNPRGSAFQRILFAQPSTSNFVSLGTNTGNTIYFYVIENGVTYSAATTTSITQNAWTHIAARWTTAGNTVEVFFNGVQQSTVAGGSSSTGTNGLMVLGSRPGGAQYFNGMMDEVRVWSEARSLCQIQVNMNLSITGAQTNLVADYDFNQGTAGGNNTSVTTLPDNSGFGFNGTLTNFTLTAATSNWVTSAANVTSSGNPYVGIPVSEAATICSGSSYTFPDGTTLTNITSTVAHQSTVNGPTCDTVITTTVSVNSVYAVADTQAVCSGASYTFPDATTTSNITSTVTHASTLQSITGCDSVINTVVNVLPGSAFSETNAVCPGGNYTFPDGSTQTNITSQVIYVSTLTNAVGCDSVVTTTVNVYPVYASSDSAWICYGGSYTFADGSTMTNITSTAVYSSMLSSVNGCDSTITTTVAIIQVDTAVSMVNETLTANATGAVYQWLDCGNGYAPIAGDTNQSFTATVNGSYALAITQNGCTDTSGCYLILSTGNSVTHTSNTFAVYPNPAHDVIYVMAGTSEGTAEITDVSGAVVRTAQFTSGTFSIDLSDLAEGMYILKLETAEGMNVCKIQKD